MGLAHEKKSYLQEKANLFEIGSRLTLFLGGYHEKIIHLDRTPCEDYLLNIRFV